MEQPVSGWRGKQSPARQPLLNLAKQRNGAKPRLLFSKANWAAAARARIYHLDWSSRRINTRLCTKKHDQYCSAGVGQGGRRRHRILQGISAISVGNWGEGSNALARKSAHHQGAQDPATEPADQGASPPRPSTASTSRASRSAMPPSSARCCELFADQVPVYVARLREAATCEGLEGSRPHHQGLRFRHRRLAARALCRDGREDRRGGRLARPKGTRRGRRRRGHGERGGLPVHRAALPGGLTPSASTARAASGPGLNLRGCPLTLPPSHGSGCRRPSPIGPARPMRLPPERERRPAGRSPSMAKITYTQPDGTQQIVDADPGMTVMEAAKKHLIAGIEAECGGACSCATCHVYRRRGLAREDRRALRDGGGHARLRLRRAPLEPALLPDQGDADALDGLVVAVPEKQF